MELRARYEAELARCGFDRDPAQAQVVAALDRLGRELSQSAPRQRWRGRLRLLRRADPEPVRGLYIWGGVGRGKTFLMDLFFAGVPLEHKRRSHFHRFMHDVHARLKSLGQGKDPLDRIARDLAEEARLLCFDEFFVSDIADAMILARLLRGLFRRGVTLVATSNIVPSGLYAGGLQRQRFLPAIALLEKHTEVMELYGEADYRLRVLERAEIYHSPLDAVADTNLDRYFEDIAPEAGERDQDLIVEGRPIRTRRLADGVVWFDFADICDGPRSQTDYIELARCYQSVLISDVPVLTREHEDQARRFIALVDEFYDHGVKLILSAAVPLDELYQGRRLAFEFERTRSRLQEMQSHDYLARRHVP